MYVDTINVIYAPSSECCDDVKFDLIHGYSPPTLEFNNLKKLRLKSKSYQFIDNVLFHRNYDGVFLRSLEKTEANNILFEIHVGPARGNFLGETTTHKVLRDRY